ncbi:MAG TPA: prenyltransferase/squalene oxidase repeat-containing protein, partial [Pirellulaceae bacterium]|nr:prenyltransferase/squalene oxidase repeat-containing protein [Pirellulaceae bacterium]
MRGAARPLVKPPSLFGHCNTMDQADPNKPVAAPPPLDLDRLRLAYHRARADLLEARTSTGHWVGELSTSALSTATAVSALSLVASSTNTPPSPLVAPAVRWLVKQQNGDGGWGDTDKSHSNIATTMLVRAALHLAGAADEHVEALKRAIEYVERSGALAGLRRRYGRDKTFAVPILTNCALAGLVPWRDVSQLPFEMAWMPPSWFRFLQLPVVSYAIPALVAIGQARHFHRRGWFPPLNWLRDRAVAPTLDVIEKMQPSSGGYLEAIPLTSFVVMSLAATGRAEHPVAREGVRFIHESVRTDGSWPIDTNLATWNTSLALGALASGGEDLPMTCGRPVTWPTPIGAGCLDWLLSCQHRTRHPFTQAAPGGWGWTDLSGAVPDSDDTPGALLALAAWRASPRCKPLDAPRIDEAAGPGVSWLLDLQNRDGGWPTFCRGWGKLPFDRSGADLTAHALRALEAWKTSAAVASQRERIEAAQLRGFDYLASQQRPDGRWVPLWFGNQDDPAEENPVYGTGRVLLAYRDCGRIGRAAARRGLDWLAQNQAAGGGWGSVEETAVAVEAMTADPIAPTLQPALRLGLDSLIRTV